ncbi:MAG TPA: hypothetical protein DCY07_05765 [Rhodospirillaceae bacterium]|nr:hypothetical protein [Rhodospirillaceae bacterium]
MKHLIFLIPLLFWGAGTAHAAPADAREVARINNCIPKKIEVYQQGMGVDSPTTYRVECIAPKTVGENVPKMPPSMLVRCSGSLCEMLRPLTESKQ